MLILILVERSLVLVWIPVEVPLVLVLILVEQHLVIVLILVAHALCSANQGKAGGYSEHLMPSRPVQRESG